MRTAIVILATTAACGSAAPPPAAPIAAPIAPASPAPAPASPPSRAFAADRNLGFEDTGGREGLGTWGVVGGTTDTWTSVTDVVHDGARAVRVDYTPGSTFGSLITSVPADAVRGKHLALHAWIKTDASAVGVGLWLRVDGPTDRFVDLGARRISGETPWTEVEIALDVPDDAKQIVFAPKIEGAGRAWFDDLRFTISETIKPHPIRIDGHVTDAAKHPISGADVALAGSASISQHVQTDATGAFSFATTSGEWSVSATTASATGPVGAFIERREFQADARDLVLVLGTGDGVAIHGRVQPPPGVPGAYVELSLVSEHTGDTFAVPVAADGSFATRVPRADHFGATLGGGPIGAAAGERVGDQVDIVIRGTVLGPPPAEVVAWLTAHAAPLTTTEAGHGFADLAPLGTLVGKARIVALGEATHGSREFFQLKHRALEYLVATQGFTVFAIEANQPECRAINDYVLHDTGNAKAALDGIYFWTWNTEEVLAMIEWMRAWNADAHHAAKVQFTGFDMQTTKVAYANVVAYVAKVDPKAPPLAASLAVFGQASPDEAIAKLDPAARALLVADLDHLAADFDQRRAAWTRASSAAEYADIRHDLTILGQAREMFVAGQGGAFAIRDRSMAANLDWLVAHEPAGTRIVVWAHNAHIANSINAVVANMGGLVRKRYGKAYVNLGFLFGQGAFQAIGGDGAGLGEHALGDPPESHASVAFTRTGNPLSLVDLRTLPASGVVHDWFTSAHPVRETGALFTTEANMTEAQVLPELYDGLWFVDRTTRARPLHAK